MKCAIADCRSVYLKKGQDTSFFKFPNSPKLLTAWVAATGIPNFIPTHNSKVCSLHFEESAFILMGFMRKLKLDAVPTKFLTEDASRRVSEYLSKQGERNPVACILGEGTQMKQVAVVRDNVPPSPKNIVVTRPPHPPLPKNPAPGNSIKVVDMKKLLEPSAVTTEVNAQVKPVKKEHLETTLSNVETLLNKYVYRNDIKNYLPESNVNNTGITANQVLSCLRIILPGKFDLSRMIPNEKVASLVIRYLKLDEKNEEIQKVVKKHLEIIIEAVKAKDNKSVDFSKHPYTKITDRDLKRALSVILPEDFSMIDITDELLGLLCITLGLNIYKDAYYILIRKIRKFTSEGQKFSEILNLGSKEYDDSIVTEKEIIGANESFPNDKEKNSRINDENSADSEVVCIGEQKKEVEFIDISKLTENSQGTLDTLDTVLYNVVEASSKKDINQASKRSSNDISESYRKTSKIDSDLLSDTEEKIHKRKNKAVDSDWVPDKKWCSMNREIGRDKLFGIVKYLHEKKLSANDVLYSSNLIFHLCRFIDIMPKKDNVKMVKTKLNYIIDNKLNFNNINDHLTQRSSLRMKSPSSGSKSPNVGKRKRDAKLQMSPVVVLQDLIDFNMNDIFFVRKKKIKSNGFYNQDKFSLKKNPSTKKYTPEQVRKITDDSYSQFRKIVLKKEGTKGFFCRKYTKLSLGTVVFAKNYRHPGVGWVRGVISKHEGIWRYQVRLDNHSTWSCTADQLRPVLNKDSVEYQTAHEVSVRERSHRPIKPKQLFDL